MKADEDSFYILKVCTGVILYGPNNYIVDEGEGIRNLRQHRRYHSAEMTRTIGETKNHSLRQVNAICCNNCGVLLSPRGHWDVMERAPNIDCGIERRPL